MIIFTLIILGIIYLCIRKSNIKNILKTDPLIVLMNVEEPSIREIVKMLLVYRTKSEAGCEYSTTILKHLDPELRESCDNTEMVKMVLTTESTEAEIDEMFDKVEEETYEEWSVADMKDYIASDIEDYIASNV
jgi:hypothetical protein